MDIDTILKKQEKYMWGTWNYYEKPISIARGAGMYVWDTDGNRYLDMFGGMLTLSTGHCHPKVVEAIKSQVETLIFAPSLYAHEKAVVYAEMLAEITPPRLSKAYFALSGTEAVENAIKLAKQYTGAQEVIALRGAYHGLTSLGMTLTAFPDFRLGGTQVAGVKHAVQPNCYRCAFHLTYPECDVACAYDIEEIIQKTTSGRIAAFIAEPIAGVSGLITPPPEYFEIAVGIVRNNLIIRNRGGSDFGGGGLWLVRSDDVHVVENNTIVENVSFLDGAGVLVWDNVAALQNNIVWGNLPPAAGQISLRFGAGAEGDREEREEIS